MKTAELYCIASRLREYYTLEEINEWLDTPHNLLAGEKPFDLIERGEAKKVIVILDALDECVYL